MYKHNVVGVSFFLSLMVVLFLGVSIVQASPETGFVDGVWFSNDFAVEGKAVTIFSAIQNQSNQTVKGVATFFDGNIELGKVDFSVGPKSLKQISLDSELSVGKRTIRVIAETTEGTLSITTLEGSLVGYKDTDKDGIRDIDDTDDDNDGISDEDEKKNGTDPLVANSKEEGDDSPDTGDDSSKKPATRVLEVIVEKGEVAEGFVQPIVEGITESIEGLVDDIAFAGSDAHRKKSDEVTTSVTKDGLKGFFIPKSDSGEFVGVSREIIGKDGLSLWKKVASIFLSVVAWALGFWRLILLFLVLLLLWKILRRFSGY